MTLCDRCQEEISEVNLLDGFPEVDRFHHVVSGVELSPREWEFFSLLCVRQKPVSKIEIEDYVYGTYITNNLIRTHVCKLRRKLCNTPFRVFTCRGGSHDDGSRYELRRVNT